jgi:putative hydrolase of the HAD superfamily
MTRLLSCSGRCSGRTRALRPGAWRRRGHASSGYVAGVAPLPPPRALLFDLGNTILREGDFEPRAGHRRLLELAGVDATPQLLDAYGALAAELAEDVQPRRLDSCIEFGTARMTRVLAHHFDLRFSQGDDELELAFFRASTTMAPEPGIREALHRVRSLGVPIGVVSNTAYSGHVLRAELAHHSLLDGFDFVMASNDYGFRKPHPAIFRAAAARLGLDPRHVWFLGDSLVFDVAGARAVGMPAVWYNPHGGDAGAVRPDAELRAWDALGSLLG